MRLAGTIAAALTLAGCASVEPPAVCPAGQESLRTAQLFFGRNIGTKPGVSEAAFAKFLDEELTPRFPDGLTVIDGGGQCRGAENILIREASKVVLIVLPPKGDASKRVNAARDAYKARFSQEAVLVATQAACVSF